MIASGSRPARRERRGWVARSGNSWRSVSTVTCGWSSAKPFSSGATASAGVPCGGGLSRNALKPGSTTGSTPAGCSISSSASRRPGLSAATSTRPG